MDSLLTSKGWTYHTMTYDSANKNQITRYGYNVGDSGKTAFGWVYIYEDSNNNVLRIDYKHFNHIDLYNFAISELIKERYKYKGATKTSTAISRFYKKDNKMVVVISDSKASDVNTDVQTYTTCIMSEEELKKLQ